MLESLIPSIAAVSAEGGGVITFYGGLYVTSGTIILRRGVILQGVTGQTRIKLADNANCNVVDSYRFDDFRAASVGSITEDPDYTQDYGLRGLTIDANAQGQSTANLLFGVRMYGRRLTLENCVIAFTKGVGLHTCAFGAHAGSYDYDETKTPGKIDQVEVVYSNDESWIYEGPSDQAIGTFVTNGSGLVSNNGTVPQTSRFYPGEEVSAVVWAAWGEFQYMNLNGARFGHCFRSRGSNRINGNNLICAGGWGNVYIEAGAFGAIDKVLSQANPYAWLSTPKAHVENLASGMYFGCVTIRRGDAQDSGAPGVKDSGGANWGQVKSRQSLTAGGTLFMADGPGTTARIDARGPAIALHTTSSSDALDVEIYFNNVGLVWKNEKAALTGSFSIRGTLNAGQVFETGVTASPGIAKEALRKADISFLDNGVRKNNTFHGAQTVATDTTGAKTVTFTHGLWRAPLVEDIQLTFRHSGATTPAKVSVPYITGFSATTVTARLDVETAHTGGSPTSQLACLIT